jgi:hypothetical protein
MKSLVLIAVAVAVSGVACVGYVNASINGLVEDNTNTTYLQNASEVSDLQPALYVTSYQQTVNPQRTINGTELQ